MLINVFFLYICVTHVWGLAWLCDEVCVVLICSVLESGVGVCIAVGVCVCMRGLGLVVLLPPGVAGKLGVSVECTNKIMLIRFYCIDLPIFNGS